MFFVESISHITDADLMIFDPSKRLFWGNIVGAVFLLFIIPGRDKFDRFKTLFSRKIWFHASSRADMKIVVTNTLFRLFLLPASLFSSVAIAAVVSLALTYAFGGKPRLHIPIGSISVAFSVSLFLADDFARFFLHYLQHRWPLFWVFHQTHHSALVLTPLTLLRTHPVEIITARLRSTISYGLITGMFFYLLGTNVTTWDIIGTEILGFTFNMLGANLRHSHVWIHFGPFEKYLISPAAHQVHHSVEEQHYDKNFGVCLAIWDRMFGTHFDPRTVTAPLQFGLPGSPLSDPKQKLFTLYFQPFRDLKSVWKEKNRRNDSN